MSAPISITGDIYQEFFFIKAIQINLRARSIILFLLENPTPAAQNTVTKGITQPAVTRANVHRRLMKPSKDRLYREVFVSKVTPSSNIQDPEDVWVL